MKNKLSSAELVLRRLRSLADPKVRDGGLRFGIKGKKILGITIPALRGLAKDIRKNHRLADGLWKSGIHEARILAAYVEEAERMTPGQMDRWAEDFDAWDLCDQVCGNLFVYTPWAEAKAVEWANREEEFVKRAGYVLMAYLAVHAKKSPDAIFRHFFPLIERGAADERNFVRKAVNWALRQIGKRNPRLRKSALLCGKRIPKQKTKSANWVARDALRELQEHGSRTQA